MRKLTGFRHRNREINGFAPNGIDVLRENAGMVTTARK
jgi:hypothetical protein